MDKLHSRSMAERTLPQSEGAELEALLDEFQREHAVKEISGWETGFPNLSRALDGILPGLYWLIGPPAYGKTSLAKQLLDQVAMHNGVSGIFFTFAEHKKELGIKTLARLSQIESREIRRGSAYLLHWYGVPKAHTADAERLAPSWEKIRELAQEAKPWLDLVYIVECSRGTNLAQIEAHIRAVQTISPTNQVFGVIDDCQRLGPMDQSLNGRLPILAERLHETAVNLNIPILATWPDLAEDRGNLPQIWSERVPSANAILVLSIDLERCKKVGESYQAVTLHILTNSAGEKGKLAYDFLPAFAKFVEVIAS